MEENRSVLDGASSPADITSVRATVVRHGDEVIGVVQSAVDEGHVMRSA